MQKLALEKAALSVSAFYSQHGAAFCFYFCTISQIPNLMVWLIHVKALTPKLGALTHIFLKIVFT